MNYLMNLELSMLAFITNLRGSQLLIIGVVILLLFGTKKLPDIAKSFGKAIRAFRNSASGVQEEFTKAMEGEPVVAKQEKIEKPAEEKV